MKIVGLFDNEMNIIINTAIGGQWVNSLAWLLLFF